VHSQGAIVTRWRACRFVGLKCNLRGEFGKLAMSHQIGTNDESAEGPTP
jgi:hypothetical protein